VIVAFTVNNRPWYLRQTLDSWAKVRGIADADLIFCCEPGCPEAVNACRAVDFARTTMVHVNPQRRGVLANPWRALSLAFGLHPGFAVLAEEDLTVSTDTLEYFTWCQRYASDPTVLGVTTYQHHEIPGGLPGVGQADWARDDRWHFWVWGTWPDRWQAHLRDSWDTTYEETGAGPAQRGWDWKFRNQLIRRDGMTMIAPSVPRSQHIGRDGGAHCTPGQFQSLLSIGYTADVPPQDYQPL
jgi:hypothetical protein